MPNPTPRAPNPDDGSDLPSHPSPRVRLEVELLTSRFASAPAADVHLADERERRSVLIMTRDPDLRRYLRECLAGEGGLHLLEADSAIAALDVARAHALHLLILDADHQAIAPRLPEVPAIVVAEVVLPEPAGDAPFVAARVTLAPPFGAQALLQLARRFLG